MAELHNNFPAVVPVFPVSGAMVVPGGGTSLWVFEPRYLALVDDSLGLGRMFGLIQPRIDQTDLTDEQLREAMVNPKPVPLYDVGTLVRITHFAESKSEGGYLIRVTGLSRFKVVGEDQMKSGYRRMLVDYAPFASDTLAETSETAIDRKRLLRAVTQYLRQMGVETEAIDLAKDGTDEDLILAILMTAPLMAHEKQALLEAEGVVERASLLTTMFEMSLLSDNGPGLLH